MKASRILDVIACVLTLGFLIVAGVGHLLNWFRINGGMPDAMADLADFQAHFAIRSGLALAVATVFVVAALLFNPTGVLRKLLVVVTFAAIVTAILFEVLPLSPYGRSHLRQFVPEVSYLWEDDGWIMSIVMSSLAGFMTLVRMIWTMVSSGSSSPSGVTPTP